MSQVTFAFGVPYIHCNFKAFQRIDFANVDVVGHPFGLFGTYFVLSCVGGHRVAWNNGASGSNHSRKIMVQTCVAAACVGIVQRVGQNIPARLRPDINIL
ncbi:hypothetical protein D1872_297880 [compost metagenome]